MPAELKRRLVKSAKQAKRSLGAEVGYLLEKGQDKPTERDQAIYDAALELLNKARKR